jgi:hypothetical protein
MARLLDHGMTTTRPQPTAGLSGLLAEMQALMRILPPTEADRLRGRADYVALLEEDAVEGGFDNMPV